MTFANQHQKGLHSLFLFTVWIKGISGLLESFAGILVFLVEPRTLETFVVYLAAPELAEDPDDWLAKFAIEAASQYSADTQVFLYAYWISPGVIRVFLVSALLSGKLWAYPLSLGALALFIAYQVHRFMQTHSLWLVILTIVNLGVAYLIWEEYLLRKRV